MRVYLVMLLAVMVCGMMVYHHSYRLNNNGRWSQDAVGNFAFLLCTAILVAVAGFRYQLGVDYLVYVQGYDSLVTEMMDAIKEFREPGINLIGYISSRIYDSPYTLFFLFSLITVFLYVVTIKKNSDNFAYSIALFVLIGCWHGSFNGIRQYLAAAIIFAGHRYLKERKLIHYILVILLAMAFHRTAIIMLPIYFVVGKKISNRSIIATIIMVVVIRYSYDYLFSVMSILKGSDVTQYTYMVSEVNPLRILVTLAPVVLALYLWRMGFFPDEDSQFYIQMLMLNAAFAYGTAGSAYLARATIYTEAFAILAFPKFNKCFTKQSNTVVMAVVLVCYFGYWIVSLTTNEVLNYQWIFSYI